MREVVYMTRGIMSAENDRVVVKTDLLQGVPLQEDLPVVVHRVVEVPERENLHLLTEAVVGHPPVRRLVREHNVGHRRCRRLFILKGETFLVRVIMKTTSHIKLIRKDDVRDGQEHIVHMMVRSAD